MSAAPRGRVIVDNDFGGDPDGLFQLAHHVLCTSVEVVRVISTRVPDHMVAPDRDIVAEGVAAADEVLALAGSPLRTLAGSRDALDVQRSPAASAPAATEAIIEEAMRDDVGTPLFYAAGAGLTQLADALLREPGIAERLTLVWIGGNGYDSPADGPEFNASTDLTAARIVFESDVPIWQVPVSTYSQCLVSWSELDQDIAPAGALGSYLVERWREFTDRIERLFGASLGESAVLGDSPLVLLTALQGTFRVDPSSSPSRLLPRRRLEVDGSYGEPLADRSPVRVFTGIDMRLMYGDLVAKLAAHARSAAGD